jgi:hypothetical protein
MGCFVLAWAGLAVELGDARGMRMERDIPGSQPFWDFLELFFRCIKIVLGSFVSHSPISVSHTK